jgi:uncharacterized membrane protein YozB (DUF420 family)
VRNVSFLKVRLVSVSGHNVCRTQRHRASNALRSISHDAPGDLARRLSKWTWAGWMYVSVTGVVVYFMLHVIHW